MQTGQTLVSNLRIGHNKEDGFHQAVSLTENCSKLAQLILGLILNQKRRG